MAAMQIGVGLLQVEGEFTIMLGAAQGLLVGSLTVICGSIMEWLLTPLPEEEEDKPLHPARERVREYETAFRRQFFGPCVSGRDDGGGGGGAGHAIQDGFALEYPS